MESCKRAIFGELFAKDRCMSSSLKRRTLWHLVDKFYLTWTKDLGPFAGVKTQQFSRGTCGDTTWFEGPPNFFNSKKKKDNLDVRQP
jgi:hypothetical protein